MNQGMERPLISVVTPVYNGEKYLEECIKSVLAQTWENFEYIIVNNCSTDRTLEIARKYTRLDCRVRIHENQNFLTSLQNFNNAMRQISPLSQFCKVVHADDWIFPECLEKMADLAQKKPSIGIVGSYRLVGDKVESDGLPYTRKILPAREAARMNLTDGPYIFGSPSALLLRSDLVRSRDCFYNEAHTGADTEACLELLQECDFGFVHQVLSFSRVHDTAISGRNRNLGTNHPNFLYVYQKYGPVYLSKEEYEKGFRIKLRAYYRFLGSHLLRIGDRDFWKFHRQGFERLGYSMRWWRVLAGAAYMLLGRLLDVKSYVREGAHLYRRLVSRSF